jgi:hypothetical protein
MKVPSLILGVAAIAFGAYTAWARQARPDQF